MAHNFRNDITIDWCPGCGDFAILTALTNALGELNLDPTEVVAISGIGCSGKTPHYLNIAGAHTLHGRAIPYAVGVKLSNPKLKVLTIGGDGDLLGIGAGHFVAEGRRNSGIVVIMFDNGVYGLTKGQAAPTLPFGEKTKSLARPNIMGKINPVGLALTSGYTFVARAFSSEIRQLTEIIKKALNHNGSAFIDVLQPCPTYNDVNTLDWYRKRVYKLENDKSWDPVINSDDELEAKFIRSYEKSMEWGDKIPIGIFLENRTIPSYPERLKDIVPQYFENPPALQEVSDADGYTIVDPIATFVDKNIE
ncbi:2-oxoacid:ferredoxin oxidoreductase subunit beta [Picrophilus oshimae]|uniref:2-oxoglutarate ferredoxin oxidoreductase subunit beta n=1 Tax=Picrophilus torridus (strain ATCC 700027 / DSM 9790 / JCM 10055 / NBRC 100828 / KAW 2/3) TaxID=1122961 RepID=Q6L0B8_PICTO|nr:2-oxoacid:ferredoxin oxidoreductase subunit beta [Picrophilus oshimae]AAT43584.1 2-oxoglutarate synthase, beta chain [Picrophilus oshimae DSM 9789]SMD31208.1 2-oxoglutarate ferredoxin oxidoreductase subunit beta [Picrophilus oshimae DSM 9789]